LCASHKIEGTGRFLSTRSHCKYWLAEPERFDNDIARITTNVRFSDPQPFKTP